MTALAACLLGCRDSSTAPALTPPDRDAAALFQTDSLSYTLSDNGFYAAKIEIELTNTTSGTIYLANCHGQSPVSLEKLVNGEWKWTWGAIIPSCASYPIVMAPNATYKPQVLFYAGFDGTNLAQKFKLYPIDGIYRFVWTDGPALRVVDTFDTDNLVPLAQRVSNRFALRTKVQ